MQEKDALLVIDLQSDFCPGGSLPVPEGDQVVPIFNEYMDSFRKNNLPIVVTRDWHPEKTTHFKAYGGIWPAHCIQGTKGAEFHPGLKISQGAEIFTKGDRPDEDAYSGFQGRNAQGLGLADYLRQQGVTRLFVGGLATDYCVKATVLDGLKEGFKVVLLEEAIRGVDLKPGDSKDALQEMFQAGAERRTEL